MVYPRIDTPTIYNWELKNNATTGQHYDRYDYPRAWPSHDQLHKEFAVLAAVNAMVACVTFLLVIALIRSKRVQKNPLNLYLLFIAIPDFLASFLCFITCTMSAPRSQYYSEAMCGFQSFYLNFAFIANAWLNGIIVYQIHRLLLFSNIRRRYQPPTHQRVLQHAGCVYLYALAWGFLCGFNIKGLPHSSHLYYGFACMPMEYDVASTMFFWIVFLPVSLGIPIVYAAYVVIDIFRNNLLPPTGRRRKLSLFLLRLCFLYFAIWVPFLVLLLVGNFVPITPLMCYVGAILSHLQGMLSTLFCLTNDDIKRSYIKVLKCQCCATRGAGDQDGSSSLQNDGSSLEIMNGSSLWGRRSSRRINQSLRDSFGFKVSQQFSFRLRDDINGDVEEMNNVTSNVTSAASKGNNEDGEDRDDDHAVSPFGNHLHVHYDEEEGDQTERVGNHHDHDHDHHHHNNNNNNPLYNSIEDLPIGHDNPFHDDSDDDDDDDDDDELLLEDDKEGEKEPDDHNNKKDQKARDEETPVIERM